MQLSFILVPISSYNGIERVKRKLTITHKLQEQKEGRSEIASLMISHYAHTFREITCQDLISSEVDT